LPVQWLQFLKNDVKYFFQHDFVFMPGLMRQLAGFEADP